MQPIPDTTVEAPTSAYVFRTHAFDRIQRNSSRSGISWLLHGLHQRFEQITPLPSVARKGKLSSFRGAERPVCPVQVYQCTTMITGASLQDVRTTCLCLFLTFFDLRLLGLRLSLFTL